MCMLAGALALLTASLERQAPDAVGSIVRRLLFAEELPAQQRSASALLLAKMQGAKACSALLCPWLVETELKEMPGM